MGVFHAQAFPLRAISLFLRRPLLWRALPYAAVAALAYGTVAFSLALHEHRLAAYAATVAGPATATRPGSGVRQLSGVIDASSAGGLPAGVEAQLQRLFPPNSGDARVIVGTRYRLLLRADGAAAAPALTVVAAELDDHGRYSRAVRYPEAQTDAPYFRLDGQRLSGTALSYPVELPVISSAFGPRRQPWGSGRQGHGGLDLAVAEGTPVVAAADGTVAYAGARGSYGNLLVVQHGHGVETRYGHLARFAAGVVAGATVQRGALLGYAGRSGRVTGAHLHFEVREDGAPVDPLLAVGIVSPPLPAAERDAFHHQVVQQWQQLAAGP